ncbi:MAG: F0F1 ATP synthase subunit A [Verrucomicrobiales bacterium]|nr:F0F1 ATP synthase subunit A [Verrucomicrobiales bacterium]
MQIHSIDQAFSHVVLAAGGLDAPHIPGLGGMTAYLTNSIVMAVLVTVAILLFTRIATRKMTMVPDGKQNFVEFVIEMLYGQVEGIVGEKVAPKVFPLLATLFVFILCANWSGLIPGVGTVGFGEKIGFLTLDPEDHNFVPLFRPPTADFNMTLALAAVFMGMWTWITIKELGVFGFIKHVFAPKGGLSGGLWWGLLPIFIFVGFIEIISIMFRPVTLSFRLLGNVYAGETLLHSMSNIGEQMGLTGVWAFVSSVLVPLPFYFMEILVGLIQAIVFTLLCAVYVQLSTEHDEEGHDEGGESAH